MEPLLCYPDPLPTEVVLALDRAGYRWKAVDRPDLARAAEPDDAWAGALICAHSRPDTAFAICRQLRSGDDPLSPIVLVLRADQLSDLRSREDDFDDICLIPLHGDELGARLDRLMRRAGRGPSDSIIENGPLVVNELLRFLAARPGKVFTRETLLNRVWGYEYYGGARTVDVHVRRLRAKLGEENAHLIQTVRSVGYRFGQGAWS
jgi:two-component system, OmpR family, alkaline phosphatase synthesis response regulator PhoP